MAKAEKIIYYVVAEADLLPLPNGNFTCFFCENQKNYNAFGMRQHYENCDSNPESVRNCIDREIGLKFDKENEIAPFSCLKCPDRKYAKRQKMLEHIKQKHPTVNIEHITNRIKLERIKNYKGSKEAGITQM